MKKKILAVDDDPVILELIRSSLPIDQYEVMTATSAEEALATFSSQPTQVILSDLRMPGMSGQDLIQKIFEQGESPLFIILTSVTDTKSVIELFKRGVHDYIIKPFIPEELENKIGNAFTFSEMKMLEENIQIERNLRIENQLNWNLFKENLIKRDSDRIESSLMTSINTNLVQGAGLGTLVSLGSMITEDMKLEGDQYKVDKDLMDMLVDNIAVTKKLISIVQETEAAITHSLVKQKVSLKEIREKIGDVLVDVEGFTLINNHQIKISEIKNFNSHKKIDLHLDSFSKVIKECLLNAMKFSDPNTSILILLEVSKDALILSILNSPQKGTEQSAGIPQAYQKLIFEPFFRLSRSVFERYETLDYGMGLCYSEKIIRNHHGKMMISNLKSYLDIDQPVLIKLMIELPFAD